MRYKDYDDFDADIAELRAQSRHQRRQLNALIRHGDCRDPDHPGCEYCEDEEGEGWE